MLHWIWLLGGAENVILLDLEYEVTLLLTTDSATDNAIKQHLANTSILNLQTKSSQPFALQGSTVQVG